MNTSRLLLAAALVLASLTLTAGAVDNRRKDSNYVMQKAFGEYDRSSGWCDGATVTPANIWDSANVPAEIASTAEGLLNRRAIRAVILQHMDGTNTTVGMCARLGPNTGATPTRSALTCVGTAGSEATNGTFLGARFAGIKWTNEEILSTGTPTVFVRSSAGTVRYCVNVFWKS